jgi:hypothetical protein
MSLDQVLFIGLGIFLGITAILQIYLVYRIRKYRQNPANISEPKMNAKESFRFGLFHTLFYSYMLIFAFSIHGRKIFLVSGSWHSSWWGLFPSKHLAMVRGITL